MTRSSLILARAAVAPVPTDVAYALTDPGIPTSELTAAAAERRDRVYGARVTYSRKVFLPLTNLCRDVCDYCSFRRSPKDEGAHTMMPVELGQVLGRARGYGCTEALFCLGDRPEATFPSYRRTLAKLGFSTTVDYLVWASRLALSCGLLPHINAGVLTAGEMAVLKRVSASLGLMLESTSERLCQIGMPHHRAVDKRPDVRLTMTRNAGELRIPFTSGILIGIGETWDERIDTLLAIRKLHKRSGHIQEVIVQPFRPHPCTPMSGADAATDDDLIRSVALARLILEDEVSLQAPPNLAPGAIERLLAAGINDFGGISPVTPDYINPGHAWPHIIDLRERCARAGFSLAPRLPIYQPWIDRPGFVAPQIADEIATVRARLDGVACSQAGAR